MSRMSKDIQTVPQTMFVQLDQTCCYTVYGMILRGVYCLRYNMNVLKVEAQTASRN